MDKKDIELTHTHDQLWAIMEEHLDQLESISKVETGLFTEADICLMRTACALIAGDICHKQAQIADIYNAE